MGTVHIVFDPGVQDAQLYTSKPGVQTPRNLQLADGIVEVMVGYYQGKWFYVVQSKIVIPANAVKIAYDECIAVKFGARPGHPGNDPSMVQK